MQKLQQGMLSVLLFFKNFVIIKAFSVRNPSVTVKKSNVNSGFWPKVKQGKKIPQSLINKGTAVLLNGEDKWTRTIDLLHVKQAL